MKPIYLIVLLIFVMLIAVPVSAETLTGTLGDSTTTSLNLGTNTTTAQNGPSLAKFMVKNMEYTAGLNTVIRFDSNPSGTSQIPTFTNATFMSGQTTFIVTCPAAANVTVATGSIGYQRFFTGWPISTETYGYQWYVFDYWNPTALTGNRVLNVWFNTANVNGISLGGNVVGNLATNPYNGFVSVGSASTTYAEYSANGWYTNNLATPWYVSYSVTKPAGLGITGTITKNVGGTTYGTQTFVVNGTSNVPIASEGTINGNTYTFNAPLNTVKLAFYSANGWSNTSVLFAPAPTPTPTPTPTGTPTPEPGTWSNISFTTRYGVNNTVIPNVFVKLKMYYEGGPMGPDDWQQAVDGYTDSNGYILFQEVDLEGWDFKANFTKPGLYDYGIGFNPTPYSWGLPVYMYPIPPDSIIPGKPATINVTVQVKKAADYTPISGAWVTIGDSISGTSYVGQATNATGYVVFPGIPNTANINGQITQSGYGALTYWVTSGNLLEGDENLVKYLHLTSVTVTPTITPVSQNAVTLTANPNSVAPGQSTTLTMTCANVTACTGAGGMHGVTYSEKYPDPSWDTHTIAIFHYNTSTSKYDYRPNVDAPWQVGTWTGLVATGTPTISGINTYYVNAKRDDYYSIGQATVGVLVTGAVEGNLNMKLASYDQTTGGHLYNYQMNLTNRNTGAITEFNTVVYEVNKLLPRGQDYTVQCSKTGYLPGSQNFQVPTDPKIVDGSMGTVVNCPLYPTGSISAGNTTVTVKVFDAENYFLLPNVQIQMSAPVIYSDSPKYTGGDGAGVFFVLGQNQPYSVTASKSGYCAVTDTGNTSTLDTKNVYLNLKYGSCLPTHTPTPGPTGTTPGVIVTPTPFNAGNATTFWRPWINVFNMMGANAGEINMLLAGLIIVLLMAVGGGVAGVLGAEVFMGFGAIFCVAVGLIPIWVVLAIIILGFLFYGLKIGR